MTQSYPNHQMQLKRKIGLDPQFSNRKVLMHRCVDHHFVIYIVLYSLCRLSPCKTSFQRADCFMNSGPILKPT